MYFRISNARESIAFSFSFFFCVQQRVLNRTGRWPMENLSFFVFLTARKSPLAGERLFTANIADAMHNATSQLS